MAVAERGSFMWFLFSITSFMISIKVMNDFEGYATTVFGGTGAAIDACNHPLPARATRELLLNPMKAIEREVHEDAIKARKRRWPCYWVLGDWDARRNDYS